MFHPTRGGVRGGKDQFSWDQVKTDKDRECYLGHSLMAPVGRWQEGKDLTWYAKEGNGSSDNKVNKEFMKAKELEEEALMAALGYKVVKKDPTTTTATDSKMTKSPTSSSLDASMNKSDDSPKKRKKSYGTTNTYGVQGQSKIKFDNKKALDDLLLKLVDKYGLDRLMETLGGGESDDKKEHKKKKKKKH